MYVCVCVCVCEHLNVAIVESAALVQSLEGCRKLIY